MFAGSDALDEMDLMKKSSEQKHQRHDVRTTYAVLSSRSDVLRTIVDVSCFTSRLLEC